MRNIMIIDRPLGVGNVYVPVRKEWIISAIGAAGGIASSLLGGAAASSAAKRAEYEQRKAQAKEAAWYNRRYNEDYVDTAAGQNLVRRAKEYANSQWRKAAGAQAVAGGTAAATQMAKDSGNKMVADTIANVAATDQMRKDNADARHRAAEAQYAQMDMQRESQRANNITSAAQAASNALMSIGSAVDQAGTKGTSLTGGSNGSDQFNPPSVDKAPDQVSPYQMYENASDAERENYRRALAQGG